MVKSGPKPWHRFGHVSRNGHGSLCRRLIAKAESETLDDKQRVAVKELKRSYINRTCLSSAFVRKQTEQRLRSEQLWRQLRPAGDWKGFLPAFSAVIDTMREEASMRADALETFAL